VLLWLLFVVGIVPRDVEGPRVRMLYSAIYSLVFLMHILIGSGLRHLSTWVRWPVGLLSGLGLAAFPAGTLINVYVLYLLFSRKGWTVLSRQYQQTVAETPHLKPGVASVFWAVFAASLVLFLPMVSMISFVLLPSILESISRR
jgi:hypothetical protein